MPISRAETVELTCPQCGHGFESRVWRLVDCAERPDLARRAREGTLNLVTCPQCDHQGHWSGHLLYHDGERERLLLAVPMQTTAGEDEEAGRRLLGELLAGLPPARRAAEYLDVERIQHLLSPGGLALALRLLDEGREPTPEALQEAALAAMPEEALRALGAARARGEKLAGLSGRQRAEALLDMLLNATGPMALSPPSQDDLGSGLQGDGRDMEENTARLAGGLPDGPGRL